MGVVIHFIRYIFVTRIFILSELCSVSYGYTKLVTYSKCTEPSYNVIEARNFQKCRCVQQFEQLSVKSTRDG